MYKFYQKTVYRFNKSLTKILRCKCKEKCKESFVTMLIYVNSYLNLAGEDYLNKIRPRTWVRKVMYLWHNKYERYSYPRVSQCYAIVAPAGLLNSLFCFFEPRHLRSFTFLHADTKWSHRSKLKDHRNVDNYN